MAEMFFTALMWAGLIVLGAITACVIFVFVAAVIEVFCKRTGKGDKHDRDDR